MKNNNFGIATTAISVLREGVNNGDKHRILYAYELIEDENFSWDGLDVPYMEWEELLDEANEILYA